jgi:F-type H+-transporting ATPase subunit delta
MTASGLEGRYALALFELADEASALPAVDKDCRALAALTAENPDFAGFLHNPLLGARTQAAAVEAIAASAGLHPLTRKFLGVLAENRRLAALPAMLGALQNLLAASRGEATAVVTSAEKLSPAQEKEIASRLGAALGQTPAIETRVDPAVLGGLKVQVGSKVIDATLKAQLDALTIQMKGA